MAKARIKNMRREYENMAIFHFVAQETENERETHSLRTPLCVKHRRTPFQEVDARNGTIITSVKYLIKWRR
jgi:hypothetical protein